MTNARENGTPRRVRPVALGCALGTALLLTAPGAAPAAAAPTPEPPAPSMLTPSTPAPDGSGAVTPDATPSAGPDVPPDLTVDSAPLVVPDDTAYAFLGAPGARVWDIEEPAGTAGLTLTGVEGPGALVIHRAGAGTAPELLARTDGADGLPEDGYPIPPRPAEPATQPVARWAFTAPGTYRLTLADSAQAEPARRTWTSTVRVGAPAPAPALVTPTPQTPPVRVPPSTSPPAAALSAATDRTVRALAASPAAAPAPAAAKAAASGTVLAAGHIDIAARVVDGKLQIQVKDGTVAGRTVWREPSSVVLHVKAAAKKRIPAGEPSPSWAGPAHPSGCSTRSSRRACCGRAGPPTTSRRAPSRAG
ncbi:hypothetical protein AB6O49_32155 [Streptomyces sp. SBR177]